MSSISVLLLLLSRFIRVRLCATPYTAAHQAPLSLGFSRQERWSGLPFPSPKNERLKWKWIRSVESDSWRPHGLQPTRLLHPWDFPAKSTGVGCHCLLLYICESAAFPIIKNYRTYSFGQGVFFLQEQLVNICWDKDIWIIKLEFSSFH